MLRALFCAMACLDSQASEIRDLVRFLCSPAVLDIQDAIPSWALPLVSLSSLSWGLYWWMRESVWQAVSAYAFPSCMLDAGDRPRGFNLLSTFLRVDAIHHLEESPLRHKVLTNSITQMDIRIGSVLVFFRSYDGTGGLRSTSKLRASSSIHCGLLRFISLVHLLLHWGEPPSLCPSSSNRMQQLTSRSFKAPSSP